MAFLLLSGSERVHLMPDGGGNAYRRREWTGYIILWQAIRWTYIWIVRGCIWLSNR
jgi:hypothetical protein